MTAVPGVGALSVAGVPVAVLSCGSGAPLLYLHGLCDVHGALPGDTPSAFIDRLAADGPGRAVHAPALPGYPGGAPASDIADVEDVVWHLADLLGALSLHRVDVVGHSIGAWYAAELALRRPDLVDRLVLVAPLGVRVAGSEVEPFFGAVAPRGVGGLGEARRLLFAAPEAEPAGAALPDDMDVDQQLRWYGGLAGAARLGWPAPHFQSRALARRLPRIAVETLIVRGAHDRLVPPAHARAFADAVPVATLVEVPGAGHAAVLERPDAVADAVAAFLGGRR